MTIWTGHSKSPAAWERRGRGAAAIAAAALLAVAVLASACGSKGQKPPALAPQTVTSVGTPDATPPPEPPPPPPPRAPSTIEKTIVIDEGGLREDTEGLVAAAEAERERRAHSTGATVVINDENLKTQAVGLLTVASPAPRPAPGAGADPGGPPPAADAPESEDYWRERVLDARRAWRELVDEIDDLESEVNLLRRRFYDEDDPYYRDSQIKPAWDRALDRLRAARLLADEAEDLVFRTLEEGRRAGALPGWLREGLELEPTPGGPREAKAQDLDPYEPGEPEIYDPDGDGR